MAEYRELRKDELSEAVALWSEVFRLEAPFFTAVLDQGGTGDDVSLAAFEDGRLVSSVHVFMRLIRGRDGVPMKVGGVGNVSTRRDHQRRGHSGRLLEMALASMARQGCVWSLLGTGVNDHYAKHGWRTVSTPDPWGTLRSDATGEAIVLTPDDATLAAMATLYDAETIGRPLATVRNERAWKEAIRYRLSGEALLLGAEEDGRLTAYVAAFASGGKWSFVEATGDPTRLPGLFGAAAAQLRAKGIERVFGPLPPDSAATSAFGAIVERIYPAESRSEMVRPIEDRIAWPDLFALYGDPRGRLSDLDAF